MSKILKTLLSSAVLLSSWYGHDHQVVVEGYGVVGGGGRGGARNGAGHRVGDSSNAKDSATPEQTSTTATTAAIVTENRRDVLRNAATGLLAALTASSSGAGPVVSPAYAATDGLTPVYFGVGCFWHIQYEFVQAEKKLLGRSDDQLTSLAGYAGGTKTGDEGRVCYHNFQRIADYGKLGHGEVVGMKLPPDQIANFAEVYFSLFDPRTKDRVDPMDRGGEYRSLLGLPGGTDHPAYPDVELAARNAGFKLEKGRGNDPDTIGKRLVYVYDTKDFPFYQAEVYHQFHDDFQSPPYGRPYNRIANQAFQDGRLQITGCPDRV